MTEKISADIACDQRCDQHDGWGRNLTVNRENKIQDYWGVRSKVVLRAERRMKFTLAGDYNENRDNMALGYKIDPGTLGTGGSHRACQTMTQP